MRLLVTGAGGLLGRHLLRQAWTQARWSDVRGMGRAELDICDAAAVRRACAGADVVINAAAWTDVDAAEAAEEAAYRVNATGPGHLAAAAIATGARLVHVSTDYVFSGAASTGVRPYEVDDPTGPSSAYGRTKLAGEIAVREIHPAATVVRTAWVYDADAGFPATMRRLMAERDTVRVVADQTGSPTFAADLAAGLLDVAARGDLPGLLHATNTGHTTWFGLAQEVFTVLGGDPGRVHPVTTAEFPRPAPRPAWSVLSDRAWRQAGLAPLRDWPAALRAALAPGHPAERAPG